jgi:predicted nucleic acid-binding protein
LEVRAALSVCLHSWAGGAWLDGDEPAATRVEAVIELQPHMSWINLAEVDSRALLALDVATPERTLVAARIKAEHAIALADCFAVATAIAHGGPLLTGDPELLDARPLGCALEDLRSR